MQEEKLNQVPRYRAQHKFAQISAQKVRVFADLIRGKYADEAMTLLQCYPNRGARMLEKVLKSAMHNAEDLRANGYDKDLTLNQDVMLTNDLSFNVRVWDESENAYVDLGSGVASGEAVADDPNDLRSFGRWSDYANSLFLPCVYDTWSEQYQRDLYLYDDYKAAIDAAHVRIANGSIADIPLDATPTSAQLKNYPPPYDVPLKSVQIEIRVFDPRSKAIRQSTFVVDLSKI